MTPYAASALPIGSAAVDGLCSPEQLVAAWQDLPGIAFFDSSGHWPTGETEVISRLAVEPIAELRGRLDAPGDLDSLRACLAQGATAHADSGGLAGWISYEGEFCFGVYPESLVYDHRQQAWREPDRVARRLAGAGLGAVVREPVRVGAFRALMTQEAFMAGVRRVQEWIAAGDVYQINLAQAYEATVEGGSLFELYRWLRRASPAPMAGWFRLGGHEILCSSPESFLQLHGRRVMTQPIKGTRPRFADADKDRQAVESLCRSEKERAELVMITDLLRNDLGQVCRYGSVRVEDLLRVETLEQVHHLVSTVTGELADGLGVVDLFAACFPGGSITGAPKKRAMEIIRELEPVPRGIYCGSLAWLGFDGTAHGNIAIRTLVRRGNQLSYHCGAGIVADSDPLMEYEETLHKAAGIRLALEQWQASDGAI